jgi:UDP-N-acetylmuramyl pentapeptide phosphotransferase/UDP-N-acetylglucosamine-1-phosphate transferase
MRLAAICLSGFIVMTIGKFWISKTGVPGLDVLLSFPIFGIAFTTFAAAGAVNAFNLIDGLNGLSAFTTISISLSLGFIAAQSGVTELSVLLIALTAIVAGFFVLNFPLGKIFLGDCGAYILGHVVTWSAIYLMHFDSGISAFAILLIFFVPIADSLFAIWRRTNLGKPRFQPDRMHFHHLVMRFLEIRLLGRSRRHIANPLSTTSMVPLILVSQFLGVISAHSEILSLLLLICFSTAYISAFYLLIIFSKKHSRKRP